MADVFWSYWDASVRFALLAAFLLLATPLLKRMLSPRLLCWAWAILLLRLVVPLTLPYDGNIFNWSESIQPSAWTDIIRKGVVNSGWGETILPVFRDQDEMVIATKIGLSWENILMALWLLGALAMTSRLLVNILRLRRFFETADFQTSGHLYELFKDTRRRYGIHANVRLVVSDEIKTPGIGGIFNPRVVLPRICADEMTDKELKCIFVHELTHFRRGDLFVHHAILLMCYLHWFNPVVWLALRSFKVSMEQACDEEVVDSDCVDTAKLYGFTLLRVLQRSKTVYPSPAGALCLLGNRKKGAMRERIELIASPKAKNPILCGIGLCIFGVSFIYAITGESRPEAEALRLFKLTRLSSPFIEKSDNASNVSLLNVSRKDKVWDYVATPSSWVRNMDVSKYMGQSVRLKAKISISGAISETELWAYVSDSDGRTLSHIRDRSVPDVPARGEHICEAVLDVPRGGVDICYGLAVVGSGSAWVEGIEALPIGLIDEPKAKGD